MSLDARAGRMHDHLWLILPDEYQDGGSVGSLVKARRHWLDLVAADRLGVPQRFTFGFACPSPRMARGLATFLEHTPHTAFMRGVHRLAVPADGVWEVAGTTRATVWSLPSLEHLSMRLRRAGSRYESTLVTLDLLPIMP
jgi:hypothetical protein